MHFSKWYAILVLQIKKERGVNMDFNKFDLGKADSSKYHEVLLKAYQQQHSELESNNQDLLDDSYIPISHKGFSGKDNVFDNTLQAAVLVSIAGFNSHFQNRLISSMISIDMIISRLMYQGNISRKRKSIKKAISELAEKDIIKITDIAGSPIQDIEAESASALISIEQQTISNKSNNISYFKIKWSEYKRIVTSDITDSNKESLLAILATIKSSMMDVDVSKNKHKDTLTILNSYRSMFCLSTIENIGLKTNTNRVTTAKYIDQLKEMDIIKALKVHRVDTPRYAWTYYYSDFARFPELTYFAEGMIDSGFVSNSKDSKYKNLSYLNIDKVYNEGVNIVRDGKEFKVKGE